MPEIGVSDEWEAKLARIAAARAVASLLIQPHKQSAKFFHFLEINDA